MGMSTRASFTMESAREVGFITITRVGGTRGTGLMGSTMVMGLRHGQKVASTEGSIGKA